MSTNLNLKPLTSFEITPLLCDSFMIPRFHFCVKNFHALSDFSLHA